MTAALIASVQNRFNQKNTDNGGLVDYTAEKDIAFLLQ